MRLGIPIATAQRRSSVAMEKCARAIGDAGCTAIRPQSVIIKQRHDRSSDRFGRAANRRHRIKAGQALRADRAGDQRQALAQRFDHLPFHPCPLPQRNHATRAMAYHSPQFDIADIGHDRDAEHAASARTRAVGFDPTIINRARGA